MQLSTRTILQSNTFTEETLHLAFQELASFLGRSPGVTMADSGTLLVDFAVNPGVKGYTVIAQGNTLRFTGPRPVEILYAVYTFAEERLGFCFFEPGNDRVEVQTVVDLPDGVIIDERMPLMKNRGFIQEYPCDESNFRLADWMARNRLNYLLTWMRHYDKFSDELKAYNRVRGITIESGHHNFDYYIPLEKYAAAHPEYFAVRDGKRIQYDTADAQLLLSKQLCVTNSDVRAELAKNMVAYAEAHPEVSVISLMPNDGFGWCECAECSKFYDTEKRGEIYCVSAHVYRAEKLYHNLLQDVAARVKAIRPDLTVSFCAYVNYMEPAEGFRLKEGMAVHAAPYWRCINHAIADASCPINRRYMASLRKWSSVKEGGVFNVYEYYMGVNFYLSLPMVYHEVVFEDIRALADAGADGILTQFHLPHWTAYGLNYCAMAKAAYGEKPSVMERTMKRLFGAETPAAEAFYAALRALQLSAGPCHVPIARSLFKRTHVERYAELLEQAKVLHALRPSNPLSGKLVVWMEYLSRFKTIFDRYQEGVDVRQEIRGFLAWADAQSSSDVVVMSRLSLYLNRAIELMDAGKEWLHFGIDWEDEYVKRYDTLLNSTDW